MTDQERLKVRAEALFSFSTFWTQVRRFDTARDSADRDRVTAIHRKMDDILKLLDELAGC